MTPEEFTALTARCFRGEPASCSTACPFHLDIRSFLDKAAKGKWASAYKLLRNATVFPVIVAELCEAPCREQCQRGDAGRRGHRHPGHRGRRPAQRQGAEARALRHPAQGAAGGRGGGGAGRAGLRRSTWRRSGTGHRVRAGRGVGRQPPRRPALPRLRRRDRPPVLRGGGGLPVRRGDRRRSTSWPSSTRSSWPRAPGASPSGCWRAGIVASTPPASPGCSWAAC